MGNKWDYNGLRPNLAKSWEYVWHCAQGIRDFCNQESDCQQGDDPKEWQNEALGTSLSKMWPGLQECNVSFWKLAWPEVYP